MPRLFFCGRMDGKNNRRRKKKLLTSPDNCDMIAYGLKEPVPKTAGASGAARGVNLARGKILKESPMDA